MDGAVRDTTTVAAQQCELDERALEAARLAATVVCLAETAACADGGVLVDTYIEAVIRAYLSALPAGGGWQPIETAPKDGTEILGYREDAGIFLMRFCAPVEFMTSLEMDDAALTDDDAEREDWFYADFISGGRVSNDGIPSHWTPLPSSPDRRPA